MYHWTYTSTCKNLHTSINAYMYTRIMHTYIDIRTRRTYEQNHTKTKNLRACVHADLHTHVCASKSGSKYMGTYPERQLFCRALPVNVGRITECVLDNSYIYV